MVSRLSSRRAGKVGAALTALSVAMLVTLVPAVSANAGEEGPAPETSQSPSSNAEETAPAEQPKAEEAPAEEPKAEEAPAEEAPAEEAPAEEPKAEEAPAEEPKAEEAPAEEAPAEEPKAEEAPAEEPKAEEAPGEEPKAEDAPAEEPAAALQVVEEQVVTPAEAPAPTNESDGSGQKAAPAADAETAVTSVTTLYLANGIGATASDSEFDNGSGCPAVAPGYDVWHFVFNPAFIQEPTSYSFGFSSGAGSFVSWQNDANPWKGIYVKTPVGAVLQSGEATGTISGEPSKSDKIVLSHTCPGTEVQRFSIDVIKVWNITGVDDEDKPVLTSDNAGTISGTVDYAEGSDVSFGAWGLNGPFDWAEGMSVTVSEGNDFDVPAIPGYTCEAPEQAGISPDQPMTGIQPGKTVEVTITNELSCVKDVDITVTKEWAPTVGVPGDIAPVLGPDNAGSLLVTVKNAADQTVGTADVWNAKATFPWTQGMDVFVSEGDDFHLPLVPGYTCSAAQTGIQPASSFLDVEPGASIAVTVTNQMTCSKDEFDITVTKVWAPTVGLQPGDTAPVLGPDNAGALLVTVTDGEGQPVGTANVWDSKATFPWSEGTDVTVSEGAQFNLPVVPGYTCSAVQTGISPQSTFENVDKDAELEVTVTNQMTCSKDQFDITVTKAWAPTVGLADGVTVTLGPENAGSLLVSVSDGNNQPVGTANVWGAKATFPWSAGTDVTVSEGSNFTIPVIDGYTCTAAQTGISQSSFTDVEKGASLQVTVTNQLTCTQDETPVAPVVPVVPEEPVTPVVVPEKPVTPVVVPEQPDSNATLPRTGGSDNTGQMALLASVLLLVGTGVLFASRRRSEADES